jgi:hypothetical protein
VAVRALDLVSDVSSARVLERMVQFNKDLHIRFPTAPAAHQFEERLREYLGQRDDIST